MSIKNSISDFFKVEDLKDNVLKLVESKVELKKLELFGKLEKILAKVIINVIMGVIVFLIFLLINAFIINTINHFTNSFWIGYAWVIGFYLILFLIFYYNKPKVSKIVEAKIAEVIVREEL